MKNCHYGPFPPPLGGVSVYIYRLSKLLPEDEYVDSGRVGRIGFIWLLLSRKRNFVIHCFLWKHIITAWLITRFTSGTFSIVIHGEETYFPHTWKWSLIKRALVSAQWIQLVNVELKEYLIKLLPDCNANSFVKHAFLPPPEEDESSILLTYDDAVFSFLEAHNPVLVANAFQLADWNGTDLYGLDMCVERVNRLKGDYPGIGLLFALANDKFRPEYFAEIKHRIREYQLEGRIYFLTGQRELWPIMKKADLMIRPTCTDGYGISIAEALFFDCPAIASDVCPRPEGAVLFKNRDMDDFEQKTRELLERHNADKV